MKITLGRRTLMMGTVTTLVVAGIALAVARGRGHRRLGVHEQQRVLHQLLPPGAPGGAAGPRRVGARARQLRRVPHGPAADAAADGGQGRALARALGDADRIRAAAARRHTMRPARDSCENCHWPTNVHDDKVRTKVHYDTDAKNTETRTRLIVHTGGGEAREGATARHPLARRPERRVRHRRRAEADDPLGPDHRQGRQDDDLRRRVEQARPRRAGPDAEAADGLRRLPQRVGAPVPQPGRPRRRGDPGGPHQPRPAVDQGARAGDHRQGVGAARAAGTAGAAVREDHRRGRGRRASSSPRRRRPRTSSRRRCSRS